MLNHEDHEGHEVCERGMRPPFVVFVFFVVQDHHGR
jgi:hypothetical protein